ncbi:hypothetical protein LEN26_009128 [Aphanomyces euteiches]|nr:hypothetical protein AeMF1_018357 [Aphanomyces euteiches]KAH9128268.1 hypothetical protein LEN26_009128 [Aphanomyces euteiches]KAH9187177.1 hypothetical protein AeNC1_010850 [Aphanomyces euteiches]
MAANLFTPIQIGSVHLKNRILMAPLTRNRAGTAHVPNDLMKEYYLQRVSAGLIITECCMLAPNTSCFGEEPGVYSEEQLVAWKEIVDAVHASEFQVGSKLEYDSDFLKCSKVGPMDFNDSEAKYI